MSIWISILNNWSLLIQTTWRNLRILYSPHSNIFEIFYQLTSKAHQSCIIEITCVNFICSVNAASHSGSISICCPTWRVIGSIPFRHRWKQQRNINAQDLASLCLVIVYSQNRKRASCSLIILISFVVEELDKPTMLKIISITILAHHPIAISTWLLEEQFFTRKSWLIKRTAEKLALLKLRWH